MRYSRQRCATMIALLGGVSPVLASPPPSISTVHSHDYLLIGRAPVNNVGSRPGVGNAVNVNNFELGANKAPTPSTSDFLNGGSSGGPGLLGNTQDIPLNAKPVFSGIGGRGNVAITHVHGKYNLQDVGVYGALGVRTAGARTNADAGTQNSFSNDPNHFPNTFTSTGFNKTGTHNTGGHGVFVNNSEAVQSTRMDGSNFAGVTGGVDFSSVNSELSAARSAINGLSATTTLNVSSSGGLLNSSLTFNVTSGLNVIDIFTGGNDFNLTNMSFVIDGPADAIAIFRMTGNHNVLVSNSNILVGNGGIEEGAVLFYNDSNTNGQHFNINNSIINGVALWSLGEAGGEIKINNAQGCTQLVADKINLNDVRFNGCGWHGWQDNPVIPLPSAAFLAGVGLLVVAGPRRRR